MVGLRDNKVNFIWYWSRYKIKKLRGTEDVNTERKLIEMYGRKYNDKPTSNNVRNGLWLSYTEKNCPSYRMNNTK